MEGKIRVLAIMTGVKSAQILGTRQSYKTVVQEIDAKRSNPRAVEMPVQRRTSSRDQPSGGGVLEWVG
jgi:cell division protein FtsZ